jgi:hypothetical protein
MFLTEIENDFNRIMKIIVELIHVKNSRLLVDLNVIEHTGGDGFDKMSCFILHSIVHESMSLWVFVMFCQNFNVFTYVTHNTNT